MPVCYQFSLIRLLLLLIFQTLCVQYGFWSGAILITMAQTEFDVKVVKSVRGKDMLAVAGYIFHCNRRMIESNTYYWECRFRCHTTDASRKKCPARARSTIVNGQHIILGITEHNHEPDPMSSEMSDFRNLLKRRACSDTGISKIIQQTLTEFPTEIQSRMSEGARRKLVERKRSKAIPHPEPVSLEEFSIPAEVQFDQFGNHLVMADIKHEENRAIIMGTDDNLKKLEQAKYWVADGTFSTVPCLFRQLLTIHGSIVPLHQNTVPLVFVLMTSKTESLYQKVLAEIVEVAGKIDITLEPEYIITDFEKALLNSVKAEFPDAKQSGCFFYFSKNLFKFIQQNKLVTELGKNSAAHTAFKKVQSLAFLPPEIIPLAFDTLKEQAPDVMKPFFSYVEETYVHGRQKRSAKVSKVARVQPMFPATLWSIYRNVIDGVSRTSNQAESWHNRWNKLVGGKHVGTIKILSEIKNEIAYTRGLIDAILSGTLNRQKKKDDVAKDLRILDIVQQYDKFELQDYLTAISNNLGSKS